VLRSGTCELAALADVPDPALVRRRGDRRRRRNAVLSGLLAFALGAGTGGIAYASLDKQAPGVASPPVHSSVVKPVPSGPTEAAAPGSSPGVVAVTSTGVLELVSPLTGVATTLLDTSQTVLGDEISVTPSGKTIYFAVKSGCGSQVESLPADGSGQPASVAAGALPAVSPDGTELAYVSEPYSGGPKRVKYATCSGQPSPEVIVMDLATRTSATYQMPGGTPVSHLSWSPDGGSLLISLGPVSGNQGWLLDMLKVTDSGGFHPAPSSGSGGYLPVPVTGDNAASSYYREGIYLPGGDLLVNRVCCSGLPAGRTSSQILEIDQSGNAVHLIANGFLANDHSSFTVDKTGQWIMYLSDNDLFVSQDGADPKVLTTGLIAAAWL
jgi:hypothetical protein